MSTGTCRSSFLKRHRHSVICWVVFSVEGSIWAVRFFALENFFFLLQPPLRLLLHALALLFALAHRFGEFALGLLFRLFVWHAGIMPQSPSQSDSAEVNIRRRRLLDEYNLPNNSLWGSTAQRRDYADSGSFQGTPVHWPS